MVNPMEIQNGGFLHRVPSVADVRHRGFPMRDPPWKGIPHGGIDPMKPIWATPEAGTPRVYHLPAKAAIDECGSLVEPMWSPPRFHHGSCSESYAGKLCQPLFTQVREQIEHDKHQRTITKIRSMVSLLALVPAELRQKHIGWRRRHVPTTCFDLRGVENVKRHNIMT